MCDLKGRGISSSTDLVRIIPTFDFTESLFIKDKERDTGNIDVVGVMKRIYCTGTDDFITVE